MSGIDLHIHSIYSDGMYSPKELIDYAKQKELTVISLTDHDTIDGLKETRVYAESQGIRFLNGIEINSYCWLDDKKISMHILGYCFQEERLADYMSILRKSREEHNLAIINALHRVGIDIEYDELKTCSDKSMITRLNFAKVLVQKGYAENVNDALERYLHKNGNAYVEFQSQPFPVVAQRIHDAGGFVSLAHPAEYNLSDDELEKLVFFLAENGLDAIEVIHPSQNTVYSQKLIDMARRYRLILTGGSDFHEKYDGINLGMGGEQMTIPETYLLDFEKWL